MPTFVIRTSLVAFVFLYCALALAQSATEHYENATESFYASELEDAFIHLKNALQEDPNLAPARVLLGRIQFNVGNAPAAEKEFDEALLLGTDINEILPVYGTALIMQNKVDKLLELEAVAKDFSRENKFEWHLLKGQAYQIRGDRDRALREFEAGAAMFPADVRSNNTLAAVYLASNMPAQARGAIDRSMMLDPENPKTWALEGEMAMAEGRQVDALGHYQKAYDYAPEDLKILRSLARVHMLLGNTEETKEYLDLILAQSAYDPAATLLTAILKIQEGDIAEGEAMLGELSNKLSELDSVQDGNDDGMLFIQASADYMRGNDQSAISLLNSYLARNRNDLGALRMLADLYQRNGQSRLAMDILDTRRETVLRDMGLTLQLLQLYVQNQNSYSANELLEQLKQTGADTPVVYVMEAELMRAKGAQGEALELLEGKQFNSREPVTVALLRGALHLDLGRMDEAEQIAQALAEKYPTNVRVHNFGAVIAMRAGDLDLAGRRIARAIEIDAEDNEAAFYQAMLAKRRGQLDTAEALARKLVQKRPEDTRAHLLLANTYLEQGRYEDALAQTRKVREYDRLSLLPAELELNVYSRSGDLDSAVKVALELTNADPLNDTYLVRLADLYMREGEKDLVQMPLRRLKALWEDKPERLRQLAGMQADSGEYAGARQSLQAALEGDPASIDTRFDLVRLDLAEGDLDNARNTLEGLEKELGQRADLAYLRGEIALAKNLPELAQEQYQRSFELQRDNPQAIRRLYELSRQGVGEQKFTEALELALKESSLPMWAVRLLADSYLLQGYTGEAAKYYESLLQIPALSGDAGILNNLANIYADIDLDKAEATARKALASGGEGSAAVLDTLGWILVQRQKQTEGLTYLRKAYELNAADPGIRYHTAVALRDLGRGDEAQKELRAVLAIGGDTPEVELSKELLDELRQ
ncbi:MAG: PEP-CTERM system TPR-repeat protein PrsT [Halioglobus sp.]|nr:PEP-CTERM system TPR-repeat protein PrsT [Halioglobus sp.]